MELITKPDFEKSMERVDAWFQGELLDRPPVRFARRAAPRKGAKWAERGWPDLRARWFDAEYQLERFLDEITGRSFLGETFPIYYPNLGPGVFAASFGCPYIFGEGTAWAEPMFKGELRENAIPALDLSNEYVKKIDELTRHALSLCPGRFLVGYTDIHPGFDLLSAFRGNEALLMDLYDDPDAVQAFYDALVDPFLLYFDRYDRMLKEAGQLSVTWMHIPSKGKLHIPSCDFSYMISQEAFDRFALGGLARECAHMDRNIFHLDGKGVARHLQSILSLPKLNAIQWVQGAGEDAPILKWIPLIQRIQEAGKGVVVDLLPQELEPLMEALSPKGLFLCLSTSCEEEERFLLERISKW